MHWFALFPRIAGRQREDVLALCGEAAHHLVLLPPRLAGGRGAAGRRRRPRPLKAAPGPASAPPLTARPPCLPGSLPRTCLAGGGDWHMAYLLLYRAQRVPKLEQ